ncbi:TBC1 domain family member 5 homolog A-like [Mytilus edulis]|uniref:TBC1 domain family member 5 homolog A-like n=1 Tax=Mytilus edulis TaxID=6550 RepID=UPI0039EF24F6
MIAWLIFFLSFKVSLVNTEEKRFLLNDPDVLVNRLNRLESVVAVLNNTVQQQSITIQKQEKTIKQLQDYASTTQSLGTTYIRWGRKQCPNNSTELVYVHLITSEEKRLLLNDPDVLVNRLNRVENIVAILNATVKRLSTENQQQTLTIQQQEKTIQQHQISTLQQQAWITQQNTSNQQQQASIQQHQALIQQQQTTIQQQQTINQQQEQTIKQLQSSFNSIPIFIPGLGTTYIRWGRKQCSNNNTELVYSGFAGGSHYTDAGAAAEYVCLPPDPDYVKTSGTEYGRMYGAEFDNAFFASNANDEDVPCALCRTERATSVVMIP